MGHLYLYPIEHVGVIILHLLSILYGATGEMTPRALFLLGDGSTGVLLSPQSACSRGSG